MLSSLLRRRNRVRQEAFDFSGGFGVNWYPKSGKDGHGVAADADRDRGGTATDDEMALTEWSVGEGVEQALLPAV
ncbi:hypothetical protein ACPZ19_40890 [Amycolatopsis lurida]